MGHTRRRLLVVTAGGVAGLAGCSGLDGADGDPSSPTETETPTGPGATPTGDPGTASEAETRTATTGAGGRTVTETAAATSTGGATVEMENTTFVPARATVAVGETVEWVNRDGHGHDVTSAAFHDAAADWEFRSETVGEGGTVSYTFESAGVYEYYCDVHGRGAMCGVVLVGDASLEGALPCESG